KAPYYDRNNDVLYLTFSDKSNSYGDDTNERVTVMRDWGTDEVTGLIVYDFISSLNIPLAVTELAAS
ncbi:MAG: hypothetical protein LBN97_00735, partial [Oscillospiraceae bacterium]|nr:hypothetical protein [Oscillospiraceae bacterium]